MLKPLKLELYNHETGKSEVEKVDFISGRFVRKALKVMSAMDNPDNPDEEAADLLVEYVAEVFQVDADRIWDGIDAREFLSTLTNIIQEILGTNAGDGGPAEK